MLIILEWRPPSGSVWGAYWLFCLFGIRKTESDNVFLLSFLIESDCNMPTFFLSFLILKGLANLRKPVSPPKETIQQVVDMLEVSGETGHLWWASIRVKVCNRTLPPPPPLNKRILSYSPQNDEIDGVAEVDDSVDPTAQQSEPSLPIVKKVILIYHYSCLRLLSNSLSDLNLKQHF